MRPSTSQLGPLSKEYVLPPSARKRPRVGSLAKEYVPPPSARNRRRVGSEKKKPEPLPSQRLAALMRGTSYPFLPLQLLYALRPFQTLNFPVKFDESDLSSRHLRKLPRFVMFPSSIHLVPLACVEHRRGASDPSLLALVLRTTDSVVEVDQAHLRRTKDPRRGIAHLELVAFPTGDPNAGSDEPHAPSATNHKPQHLSRVVRLSTEFVHKWSMWSFLVASKTLDSYIPHHPSMLRSRSGYDRSTVYAMQGSRGRHRGTFLVITPEAYPPPTFQSTFPPPDSGECPDIAAVVHSPFPLLPFLHPIFDEEAPSRTNPSVQVSADTAGCTLLLGLKATSLRVASDVQQSSLICIESQEANAFNVTTLNYNLPKLRISLQIGAEKTIVQVETVSPMVCTCPSSQAGLLTEFHHLFVVRRC